MKKLVLITMACFLGLSANTESALGKDKSKLNSSNKSEAVVENKSGLPKVIDFYATWCQPCKKLAPVLEELEKSYKGKIEFERLDAEQPQNKAIVEKYEVAAYPTLVFVDKSGKLVDRKEGYADKEAEKEKIDLTKKLDKLAK